MKRCSFARRANEAFGIVVVATALSAAATWLAPPPACAQSAEALDRSALEHYHNLDVDAARAALDRAIASSTRLSAAVRARLHVHRGVVIFAGQGQRQLGTDDFITALTIDPAVQLDANLSTPEIESAFELARQRVARGATARPTATATATATAAATVTPTVTAVAPTSTAPTPAQTAATSAAADATVPSADANADADANLNTASDVDAAAAGDRLVGDACDDSAECGAGLTCDSGICTPPYVEPTTPTRFFFQFGYGFGGGWASANMEADSTVPYDQLSKPSSWNESVNGPYAPPGYTEAQWQNVLLATYGAYEVPGPSGSGGALFASPDCDVDPGHYCVRVTNTGFAPIGGLHIAFGYWITPRIGASMEWRVQTHAGNGTFSRIMGSARVHYRFTEERLTGLGIDAFAGIGFGQIQLRPTQGRYTGPSLCEQGSVSSGQRCDDPTANPTPSAAYLLEGTHQQEPWIQTGPLSIQLGGNIGYHFTRAVGAFARPMVYVMVPATSFAMELTLGGEVAF